MASKISCGAVRFLPYLLAGTQQGRFHLTDDSIDLREQLTRIDRAMAETQKLQEESCKFAAETRKLTLEQRWFPWLQLTSSGAIAAVVAAAVAHWC
jgi:hypothetical protein